MTSARITGNGPEELKILAAKLKGADPLLRRELRKALREAAEPAAVAARRSILSMRAKDFPEVPGHYQGQLRTEVAASILVRPVIGRSAIRVQVVAEPKKMPPGKQGLPALLEAPSFKHPVFARGERFTKGPSRARRYRHLPVRERPLVYRGAWPWVRQVGKPFWFSDAITRAAPEAQRNVREAMDATAQYLTGAV
jgi:hypothetical protein